MGRHQGWVGGEWGRGDEKHFDQGRDAAEGIVRKTLREIGYGAAEYDIDPDGCEVEIRFNHQSEQIAEGVDRREAVLGAGDQGLIVESNLHFAAIRIDIVLVCTVPDLPQGLALDVVHE